MRESERENEQNMSRLKRRRDSQKFTIGNSKFSVDKRLMTNIFPLQAVRDLSSPNFFCGRYGV